MVFREFLEVILTHKLSEGLPSLGFFHLEAQPGLATTLISEDRLGGKGIPSGMCMCASRCLCSECPYVCSVLFLESESDEMCAFGVQLSSRTEMTRGLWSADMLGGPEAKILGDGPGHSGELRG